MRFTCEQVRLLLSHLSTYAMLLSKKDHNVRNKIELRTKHSFTIHVLLLIPASYCKVKVTTRTVSLVALVNLQITGTVANWSKQER